MLQLHNPVRKGLSVSNDARMVGMLPVSVAEFKFVGFDVRLQIEAKNRLVTLDNEKRKNLAQESASIKAFDFPNKLRSVIGVPFGMIVRVKRSFELFMQRRNDRLVSHSDSGANLPSNVSTVWLGVSSNATESFSIEQSSGVSKLHKSSLVATDMSANSGNIQTGQSRTKQAERPGVRREQVPTAKAKICSELRRNTQTLTETIKGRHVGADYSTHVELTDCNTDYLYFRPHQDRNFVPIGGERQSVNQDAIVKLIGWAGNLTCSGSEFQGVLIA